VFLLVPAHPGRPGQRAVKQLLLLLSIHALAVKIQPEKVVQWCADGDFLLNFCVLYFQQATCSTFQTCIINLH